MPSIFSSIFDTSSVVSKTNKHRLLTEYTLDQINEISAVDVLEGLFKEYTVKDDGTILENGKPTHGYKYSKRLNIIKDFS